MLPGTVHSASAPVSFLSGYLSGRLNTPQEDDETMSTQEQEASGVHEPSSAPHPDARRHHHASASPFGGPRPGRAEELRLSPPGSSFCCYQPPCCLPPGYSQPTPFPSRDGGAWLHPSFASSWSGYPDSLPSSPGRKDPSCRSADSSLSGYKFASLPSRHSWGSLEQPLSLCSNPPSGNLRHHALSPYTCSPQGAACCAQCPVDSFGGASPFPGHPWAPYHPAHSPYYASARPGARYIGHSAPAKERPPPHSTPLSLEQRKVFVTYEADNDKHVNEIINFVALLRHNGFDTHIDIFEQQFRSISKIDFMERYLSEKEYLIIIIISPKYHETVTASPGAPQTDERTFNTVYIHKQLQNEFIQNGSKNFRFIPIVFPGAKKHHVPNWLQNTHVYEWPLHRDDIVRRLMRVEKYNPPPIGELPTIVSIPI
ncbi:uncharacterized protein LOC120824106 isoform X1 [Gasterosteus aculeatus]